MAGCGCASEPAASDPTNIGVIPVYFTRSGISQPETFALFDGVDHQLALDAGAAHDRLFIDVPPGAGSLTVSAEALDAEMNDGLELELRRLDFDAALVDPPFAAAPAGAPVVGSDSGGGGAGPSVTVAGGSLQAGRWYAVVSNGNDSPVAVEVRADVASQGAASPIHRGLWNPSSRPGLRQGYDYNWGGTDRALIWYTYEEKRPAGLVHRRQRDGQRQHLGFGSVPRDQRRRAASSWPRSATFPSPPWRRTMHCSPSRCSASPAPTACNPSPR